MSLEAARAHASALSTSTSHSARRGGITTLFGPSGAGKTVTLRCIAGLEPSGGRSHRRRRPAPLRLERRVDLPRPCTAHRVRLPAVRLFPHLDVGANVGFGLDGSRADRAARVDELLRMVGSRGIREPTPARPLRRRAAACRTRPGARAGSRSPPPRRAARRPRHPRSAEASARSCAGSTRSPAYRWFWSPIVRPRCASCRTGSSSSRREGCSAPGAPMRYCATPAVRKRPSSSRTSGTEALRREHDRPPPLRVPSGIDVAPSCGTRSDARRVDRPRRIGCRSR
jgi:hypothetical protein